MLETMLHSRAILRVQSWRVGARPPDAAQELLGIEWQSAVGGVVRGDGDTQLLCTGPTDWLLIAPDSAADQMVRTLTVALEASAYRVTNVSSALTRFGLTGPHARTVLSKVCALDMHPAGFPIGRCARTRLAGVPVVLHCRDTEAFDAIAAASYRDYLLAWLNDAAREYS
jgi:sarcosine oxidase subunit gamma